MGFMAVRALASSRKGVARVIEYTPTPPHFAPILDETAPTTSNFFAAKDENMFLKHIQHHLVKSQHLG
jgi:hypothetical protein